MGTRVFNRRFSRLGREESGTSNLPASAALQRLTKIIATLGPACDGSGHIEGLLNAGVDVFRINLSHGLSAEHLERVRRVRSAARAFARHPAVLLDLQGPKIRLGIFEHGSVQLHAGSRTVITTDSVQGNEGLLPTTYPRFARDVQVGDRVVLADGSAELLVSKKDSSSVLCDIVSGGTIADHQGTADPDTRR